MKLQMMQKGGQKKNADRVFDHQAIGVIQVRIIQYALVHPLQVRKEKRFPGFVFLRLPYTIPRRYSQCIRRTGCRVASCSFCCSVPYSSSEGALYTLSPSSASSM